MAFNPFSKDKPKRIAIRTELYLCVLLSSATAQQQIIAPRAPAWPIDGDTLNGLQLSSELIVRLR